MEISIKKITWLTLLLLLALTSYKTWAQVAVGVPKNIDEALAYLTRDFTDHDKEAFTALPENEVSGDYHMTTGMWIRNNWIYGNRDTALVKYFAKLGIYHPDDISGIIIRSFHRQLNNKPIDIDGQVAYYKNYWKPILACEEQAKITAAQLYEREAIGDSVTFLMPVTIMFNKKHIAVIRMCPNADWTFNPQQDLRVTGTITAKHKDGDGSKVFFTVRIARMNFEDTLILSKKVKPGDEMDFPLQNMRVE